MKDGHIATIADNLDGRPGEQAIDTSGLWLLPGMIDDQVHFRDAGMPHKADTGHETRVGGVTSFMEMPNTRLRHSIAPRWKRNTRTPGTTRR